MNDKNDHDYADLLDAHHVSDSVTSTTRLDEESKKLTKLSASLAAGTKISNKAHSLALEIGLDDGDQHN